MSKELKETIEFLKERKEKIKKTGKYETVIPFVMNAEKNLNKAMKMASMIEDPSYGWIIHPHSPLSRDCYESAKLIAKAFSTKDIFTFDDFLKNALTDEESDRLGNEGFWGYKNNLLSRLSYLNYKGFLDVKKIPTGKKDKSVYRINERGLDALNRQLKTEQENEVYLKTIDKHILRF